MNKSFNFVLFTIFLLACSALPPLIQSTPSQAENVSCTDLEISNKDIDDVLNYGAQVFQSTDWRRSSYTAEEQQVYVIYSHNTLYGVGFVSSLILCNAAVEVENYASDENISIILSNYESYELINSCQKDNLLLYQFKAAADSREYDAYMWLTSMEKLDRALEVMLVIPREHPDILGKYAQELFPELPFCK